MINVILMIPQEIYILPPELRQEFLCKLKHSVHKCENPTFFGRHFVFPKKEIFKVDALQQ